MIQFQKKASSKDFILDQEHNKGRFERIDENLERKVSNASNNQLEEPYDVAKFIISSLIIVLVSSLVSGLVHQRQTIFILNALCFNFVKVVTLVLVYRKANYSKPKTCSFSNPIYASTTQPQIIGQQGSIFGDDEEDDVGEDTLENVKLGMN